MNRGTLFRLAGISAILCGTLRIIAAFTAGEPTVLKELLYLAIDLALIFGVLGLYGAEWRVLGTPGFWGFLSAIAGTALIVGPDGRLAGVDLYVVGSTMTSFGISIMAVMCWRRSRERWHWGIPTAFISAIMVGSLGYAAGLELPSIGAGIVFGSGMIAVGVHVFRGAEFTQL